MVVVLLVDGSPSFPFRVELCGSVRVPSSHRGPSGRLRFWTAKEPCVLRLARFIGIA